MDKRKGNRKPQKPQKPKGANPAATSKTTTKPPPPPTTTNPSLKRPITSISQSSPNPPPEPSPFDIPFPSNLTQSTPNPPFAASQLPPLPPTLSPTTINIISSTSITSKVTTSLKSLSLYPAEKPPVVIFTAKADVASKMISIVEIVKRTIGGELGGKWFQYIAVDALVVENKQKKKKEMEGKGKGNDGVEEGEEEEEEEDGFEVMKTPFERIIADRTKIRSVPVMAIYLSRVRIDDLRKKHGEQTNADPAKNDS